MRLDEYFFCFCIPCAFKSYIYIFGVLVVLSSIAPEIKRSLKLLSFTTVFESIAKIQIKQASHAHNGFIKTALQQLKISLIL